MTGDKMRGADMQQPLLDAVRPVKQASPAVRVARPAAEGAADGREGMQVTKAGARVLAGESEPEIVRSHRRRIKPTPPTTKNRPKTQHGPTTQGSGATPPTRSEDPGLWAVHDELMRLDPTGGRTAYALREALDQIYDGERTGRWDYSQLMKTEKTHIGTLVEIWLQREFLFADGEELDYKIAGSDVDAKWSRNLYEWEIPLEMYSRGDKIAIVVWGNEYTNAWATGLIRISDELLKAPGKQRDKKRHLNERGCDSILWLHAGRAMIKNTLLHLTPTSIGQISTARSGQAAVNLLFRLVQGELVNRASVVTAAQQVDAAKRVRDARKHLAPEGFAIFGHYAPHPEMAAGLGLARPTLGRFISARLAPWAEGDPELAVTIAGEMWRIARPEDPIAPAPALPKQGRE